MRIVCTLLLLFVGLNAGLAQKRQTAQLKPLLLTNVTVIDATGAPPKPGMNVVISGARITQITNSQRLRIPKHAVVVDASGKYLIPGLWDMHVHIFNQISQRPPNLWYFPLFIANGITGIREMWTKPEDMKKIRLWRKEFSEGALIAPRIAAVGALVDGVEGASIRDTAAALPGPTASMVKSPEEARRMVRELKSEGIDFIKIYSNLSREDYLAIADEARKLGMPIAGHVPFQVAANEASDAGQQTMEHLNQVLETCSSKEQELSRVPGRDWSIVHDKLMVDTYDERKCRNVFSVLAKNHTWQVPTLIRKQMHYFSADLRYFTESSCLKYIPVDEQDRWIPYIARQKNLSEDEKKIRKEVWQAYLGLVAAMRDAGVGFMTGTDAGNEYICPGFSLHDELALLVKAGLSPMEALQAATLNPARYLGLLDSAGTIEKGKNADLILLDANPLEEITNTRRINAVIINGRLLDRKSLDGLLAEAEASIQR